MPCDLDDCAHGTHVAGITAGNGAGGVASFSGVAKGADIMAVQVFSAINDPLLCGPTPCPLTFMSDIMEALQRVFDLRNSYNFAAVNMSLGGGQFTSFCDTSPLKSVIDSLRAANIRHGRRLWE